MQMCPTGLDRATSLTERNTSGCWSKRCMPLASQLQRSGWNKNRCAAQRSVRRTPGTPSGNKALAAPFSVLAGKHVRLLRPDGQLHCGRQCHQFNYRLCPFFDLNADLSAGLLLSQGIEMQPEYVTRFQDHISNGRWQQAADLLPQLAQDADVITELRFLVLQQQFVEALEGGEYKQALQVLRGQLAPLNKHSNQLHHLAGGWGPVRAARSCVAIPLTCRFQGMSTHVLGFGF